MRQRGEEQVLVDGLNLFEDRDGPGDGFANHPARFDALDVLAFERAAVDPPSVGIAIAISLGLYASPAQVFDYWWSDGIPNVRYSYGSGRSLASREVGSDHVGL